LLAVVSKAEAIPRTETTKEWGLEVGCHAAREKANIDMDFQMNTIMELT
jgi:hypothetical protein